MRRMSTSTPEPDAGLAYHLVNARWCSTATRTSTPPRRSVVTREHTDAFLVRAARDRSALERLRADYLDRLHRASDDFAATEGLRNADRALATFPREHRDSAWQDRVRPARCA